MIDNIKITDSNYQYNNMNIDNFLEIKEIEKIKIWKNDLKVFQVVVYGDALDKVKINYNSPISFEIRVYAVKRNLAFSGEAVAPIDLESEKIFVSDLLLEQNELELDQNTNSFFIEIKTNLSSIDEVISFEICNEGQVIKKDLRIEIINKDLPENSFDIELWQYPYSVAEHYNVNPFSSEHEDILRSHLKSYLELGGDTITASICEDPWNGQTYSKNEVKFPSMIKWEKVGENFNFDFNHFDKWIKICEEIGLAKNKIVLYGMAPWHNSFTYYEDGILVKEKFNLGDDRYNYLWSLFLENLYSHLLEKDLIDKVYIGIDEQGFNKELFDVINKFNVTKEKPFKISAAIDNYEANAKYLENIDYASVSMIEFGKNTNKYLEFKNKRLLEDKVTTLYSCVGHKPGNFSLSHPMETTFTLAIASRSCGFLRWALDAWVKDPIKDTTHTAFEPGDCFLIYPNIEKNGFNKSIRYLKIKEGIYIANKIKMIEKENNKLIEDLFNSFDTKIVYSREYLNDSQLNALESDIEKIDKLLNA